MLEQIEKTIYKVAIYIRLSKEYVGWMSNIKLVKNKNQNCLFLYQTEGISMAVPMKNGGMKKSKVIFYVVLSGVTTGIGAFLGALIGGISQSIIAMCLSFAAGAMIYIVSGELTPEANNLYHGRMTAVGSMLGLLIGIFAMSI